MGVGSWLRSLFSGGTSRVAESDHIWLTLSAKLRGIVGDIESTRSRGDVALMVAHFPNTLAGLRSLFEGSGRDFELIDEPQSASALTERLQRAQPGRAILIGSDCIGAPDGRDEPAADGAKPLSIILIESHPLPLLDDRIREFAAAIPFRCQLQTHLSLEDAVMRVFAGAWVTDMLRRLGMKDDEAIESKMVMKRIRAAQQRIKNESVGDQTAQSAEEWFQLNCPQLWKET